jgi:hypothetical protein
MPSPTIDAAKASEGESTARSMFARRGWWRRRAARSRGTSSTSLAYLADQTYLNPHPSQRVAWALPGKGLTHFPPASLLTPALRGAACLFAAVPLIRISVGVMSFFL